MAILFAAISPIEIISRSSYWKIPVSVDLCKALNLKFTLRKLIVETSWDIVQYVVDSLCEKYVANLTLLLRLATSDYFEFSIFMPGDLQRLKPLIELLKERKCPQEIVERFYHFKALQEHDSGRQFLLESNFNFAKQNWDPRKFTVEEVKKILLKIHASPPSQIEYLSDSSLIHVLERDSRYNYFFGNEKRWNMFPIVCLKLGHTKLASLKRWLDQVRPNVVTDDLLFYRLAYLHWYYQVYLAEFAKLIQELLEMVLSTDFRKLVLRHYTRAKDTKNLGHLLEIPDYILEDNPEAQAMLHFEHLIAAHDMGYKRLSNRIARLFQKFKPSQVSPFICQRLLKKLTYHNFMKLLKGALPNWKEEYWKTKQTSSYFPHELLPADIQLLIWQRSVLNPWYSFYGTSPVYPNVKRWKRHIGNEYSTLDKTIISIGKSGLTYINCLAAPHLIRAYIKGRVAELLIHNRPLPKFIPIIQKYNIMGPEIYGIEEINKTLVQALCIIKTDLQPTNEDAEKSLECIESKLLGKVPGILFASL